MAHVSSRKMSAFSKPEYAFLSSRHVRSSGEQQHFETADWQYCIAFLLIISGYILANLFLHVAWSRRQEKDSSDLSLLLLAGALGLLHSSMWETEAAEKQQKEKEEDVFVEPSTGHRYQWRLALGDGPVLHVLGGGIRLVLRYFTTYSFVLAADVSNTTIRDQLLAFAAHTPAPTQAEEDAFLRRLFAPDAHHFDTAIHIIGYREASGPHMVSGFSAKLEPLLPKNDPQVQRLYAEFCKMLPGVKKGACLFLF